MFNKFFSIIRVTGKSMLPTYKEGDYLFVTRLFFNFFIKKNRDVVFIHDKIGMMLKRVHTVEKTSKSFRVFGLSEESIASQEIGDIPFRKAIGIVFYKL